MKYEKSKYLIVDATEINKIVYKITKMFMLNDFYNIYDPDYEMDAQRIFNENGVPKELQKIIVKISSPLFGKKQAEEYTMGFRFAINDKKIVKEKEKKNILVSNCPIFTGDGFLEDKIKFKTELTYYKYDDIIKFLLIVDDSGYLKVYLKSIREFFEMTLDLDLLEDKISKNTNQAIKVYKKLK